MFIMEFFKIFLEFFGIISHLPLKKEDKDTWRIIGIPSFQQRISRVSGKIAGWPRLTLLSNTFPFSKVPW